MNKETIILSTINITPLLKANNALSDALGRVKDDLDRDGAIQRFEFSYELAWKTMKRILQHQGIIVNNPRATFREAALQGLINNPEQWFVFLEKRNQTVHVYDEDVAKEIFASLPAFKIALDSFIQHILVL